MFLHVVDVVANQSEFPPPNSYSLISRLLTITHQKGIKK
jgi:hypothetical protein